ncbi:MAG: tetratricopeptide repeat protein, partial [Cellulosimicrobium cellulans]
MGVSTLEEASARLDRALGLNARGRHDAARRDFDAVLGWCAGAGGTGASRTREVAHLVVRARIGLAVCHLESRGDVEHALDLLSDAASVVEHDGALRAVVLGQRGLVLHRTGSLGEALRAMDEAVGLVPPEDERDRAVLHMNRGSLHSDLGRLTSAAADFADCLALARRIENEMYASMAAHNLGWVMYLQGDLPAALRAMDEAAEQAPDRHAAVGLIDRAQVLLDAGLLTEADDALREAREHLSRYRMLRDLAEVELVRSRVVLGLRRYTDARRLARSASRRFDRLGNTPWMLRARVAELQESRSKLIEVSMAERRSLERDLHDGAQQRLVALSVQVGLAKRRLHSDPVGAEELLDRAGE